MGERMKGGPGNLTVAVTMLVFVLVVLYMINPCLPFRFSSEGVAVKWEEGQPVSCEAVNVKIRAVKAYVSPSALKRTGIHMLYGQLYIGEDEYDFIGSVENISDACGGNYYFRLTQGEARVGMMYMSENKKQMEIVLYQDNLEDQDFFSSNYRVVAPAGTLWEAWESALMRDESQFWEEIAGGAAMWQ